MTVPDYTDAWQEYWETRHDGGARLQIENAARDPYARWVVADARTLAENHDLDPAHLRRDPDAVLTAARRGFEAFVEATGLDRADRYDSLPVHLAGVSGLAGHRFGFDDPVEDANELVRLENVERTRRPDVHLRPAHVTYRCPMGHETTVDQSLYRVRTLNRCGEAECSNEVVPVDAETRARRVLAFGVDHDGTDLDCVVAGRYANDRTNRDRITAASRLSLTGIPRLVTDPDGSLRRVLELLHAEPI